MFILDNRKWTTFSIKDDNSKLWVEVIIFSFLDVAATEDVLTANNNDVNFFETQTYILHDHQIVVSFWENK